MNIIEHPERFKTGVRVLMLVSRNKDGLSKVKRHKRISKSVDEFNEQLEYLVRISNDNERIYSSLVELCPIKAMRRFKEVQLENDYSEDPTQFYHDCRNRWISALTKPQSRAHKLFLFDCDTKDEYRDCLNDLSYVAKEGLTYSYETKNGHHIVTEPFNIMDVSESVRGLYKGNDMILFGY